MGVGLWNQFPGGSLEPGIIERGFDSENGLGHVTLPRDRKCANETKIEGVHRHCGGGLLQRPFLSQVAEEAPKRFMPSKHR